MENGPTNDYQPLPSTATAATTNQQHQYSHIFNGPPPSYDAVLAQDELAATSKSRPKSSDPSAASSDGESNSRGLSAKLERLLNDPIGNQRRKRDLGPDFTDLGRMISLPGCDEIGNCSCPLSDSLQVYCRKCGQYVDGGLVQNHVNNNQLVGCEAITGQSGEEYGGGGTAGNTNWAGSTAIACDNLMDCDGDNNGNSIQISTGDNGITYRSISSGSALNELLLQDLQFHSPDTAAGKRSNEWNCCTSRDDARHNEENNNNLPSGASLPSPVIRYIGV